MNREINAFAPKPNPSNLTVHDYATAVIGQNIKRAWLTVINTGANDCYLELEPDTAVAGNGIYLEPGSVALFNDKMPWPFSINAICAAGLTTTISLQEASYK